MKFPILVLCSLFVLSFSLEYQFQIVHGEIPLANELEDLLFEDYMIEHSSKWIKIFPDFQSNLLERRKIFSENLQKIIRHNLNSNKTYSKGINRFTGLLPNERHSYILSSPQNCSATARSTLKSLRSVQVLKNLPPSVDWRTKGIVSPVKDQGNCGSCWTFSTTGCLEAHWALKYGVAPPSLSEQQLVDCAGDFNNLGCNGGLPSQAFEYIRYSGGINSEETYPYEGVDGSCKFDGSNIAAKIPLGSVNITAYSENELQQAVAINGPVSIAFEVTDEFESYSSGVFGDPNCQDDPEHVNHAVLVVGYGTDEEQGLDYWIVKNSWGENWGEEGYFRILRGYNECGIATCASYPNLG